MYESRADYLRRAENPFRRVDWVGDQVSCDHRPDHRSYKSEVHSWDEYRPSPRKIIYLMSGLKIIINYLIVQMIIINYLIVPIIIIHYSSNSNKYLQSALQINFFKCFWSNMQKELL